MEVNQEEMNQLEQEGVTPTQVKQGWWSKKDKSEKRGFVLTILFVIILAAILFGFVYCRQIFGNEFGDMVLGQGVENGWKMIGQFFIANSLTLVFTLVIVLASIVIFMVLKTIVKAATKKNQRTKTIGSLTVSMIRYVIVIVDFMIILTMWGVNIASAVAGVSIVAIIIGFGCKNLVADIVSGMFIVFDNYFELGDAVIIDGFRGKVVEIGLRTVKLDDKLGNIKCISNSNITTCVNLSRTLNVISVGMEIGYNEDLERVEAIMSRELPKIREKCPQMVCDPWYKGVDAFTNSGVELGFAVRCKYDDRWQVNRDLRRELYQIFNKNDIYFTFQQVVVNPADPKDRPKASKEEIALSQEVLRLQREIKAQQEEKTLLEKMLQPIKDQTKKKKTSTKKKK